MDKEGMAKKKDFLILFGALVVIGLLVFTFAEVTINTPVAVGNYSGTMNVSCQSDLENTTNASLLYSASGGAATTYLVTIFNITFNQTYFNSTSVDISSLADGMSYNITCLVTNSTNSRHYSVGRNVTIDNTPPAVNFSDTTSSVTNNGNYTSSSLGSIIINVSYSDAIWKNYGQSGARVYINVSNSSGGLAPTDNWTRALNNSHLSIFFNTTINVTDYPDGKYNITIIANDSKFLVNASGDIVTNTNNTEYIQIAIDDTAPTITLTKSTSTRNSLTLTIASSDATSGVKGACSVNREDAIIDGTTITEGGLACGNSYSYIVACSDYAGNGGSVTTSFSTDSCGGGATSGGSGGTTTTPSTTSVSTVTATPTSPATISTFASGSGVKEIEIEVSETASNVQVTVKNYETNRPSEVSASVGGAYKYINIETQNLASKLSKATMKIQVEKSWVGGQGIAKEDIALFKYDESSDEWNELTTAYDSEDDNYYYYTVELASFSYFAIASKGAVISEEEEMPTGGEEETIGLGGLPYWAWIIIILVVLAIIIGGGAALRKKK